MRLSPTERKKDAYTLNAIQGIANYCPVNHDVDIPSLLALEQTMLNLQRVEVQKEGEFKAARDNAVKAERVLHDALLTAKDQVRGQFGSSSDEFQSIGLKKKTEYKSRKTKA